MAGSLLLDTNVVVALLAGDPETRDFLSQAEMTFLPSIVLGELYYGAWKSRQKEANSSRIDALAAKSAVLPVDAVTAWHFGRIKSALGAKGRPIPENDIWIAALAKQYGLSILTRDQHFKEVDGIEIVNV
jgi:tRNA(fMet)-specific endonuclease VapC